MSDEEEENSASEEEEDEEEEDAEDEDEDEDEEGEGDDDDEDEDDEENEDQDDEEEQQDADEDESKEETEQANEKLPKFRAVEPQQFKFTNLLSEISSLSLTVDNFISSLPSHGGSSPYYRSSYTPPPLRTPPPEIPLILPREEPRIVVMKDEDTQVTMQPQIVIQPTRVEKPVEPAYKISNESSKFLAQLYEQNKKLKRWQNSSHSLNGRNLGSATGSAFYGSRERFERQEYEKGLFNVDERNKEIDEAIELLKREQE